jgi:hypothetical protein
MYSSLRGGLRDERDNGSPSDRQERSWNAHLTAACKFSCVGSNFRFQTNRSSRRIFDILHLTTQKEPGVRIFGHYGFSANVSRSFWASILAVSTPGTFFKSSMDLNEPFFVR